MVVTWEVDEGCADSGVTHQTEIDEGDLAECQDEEDRNNFINESVNEDFRNKIGWNILSKE